MVYPVLPPSANHIYIKGHILTTEARRYSEQFSMYCTQNYMHLINSELSPSPTSLYGLHLRFFFETVINKDYNNLKIPESRRAKTRYKRFDLTNRVKLLEDCVRDVIGIDDCMTFVATMEKHMDPSFPRVEIYVHEVDPSLFGVPPEEPIDLARTRQRR